MKKFLIIFAVVTMILAVSGVVQAATIRDRAEYRASTGLTLGTSYNPVGSGAPHEDAIGYVIADPFQINLIYQDGIDDSAIDAFNDYNYPGDLNFADNDYYFLRIADGGPLPIGIWDFFSDPMEQAYAPDSGEGVEWTLSYWSYSGGYFQTVFAGDMEVSGPNTTLTVRPGGGFRTFLGEGLANDVELFGGATVDSEVIAYTFSGTIGTGSTSGAELVPIPGALWLLGSGLVGLVAIRRKLRS